MQNSQNVVSKNRLTPATRLLIVAGVLAALSVAVSPVISGLPDKTKIDNVLLTGVPFIGLFIALVLAFIWAIHQLALRLNGNISPRLHGIIENGLILGVVIGMIGLFQPWEIAGYQIGFHILLACFVFFNVWSHITPKTVQREAR